MSTVHERSLAFEGGPPVRTRPWPTYDKGDVLIDEDEVSAATRAVRSKLLFRYDHRSLENTEVGRFENLLCKYFGVEHALAVSSGSTALTLGLMALGIGRGDEVLCSAFGFPASASSIMLAGAYPVLVDLDDDLHVSLKDLKRKVSRSTRALLMVHMRGQSGDIDGVLKIANEHGIPLIEDAVPVLGVEANGRHLGTYGAVGAFSTQSDKSLNTGEGGFLLTNDTRVFERAVILSGAYEGRMKKHCAGWAPAENELRLPLFNFRMDEVRGAIACAQLAKLPQRLFTLRRNYMRVATILERYPEIMIRRAYAPEATLGDTILFRLHDSTPEDAYWVAQALRAEGIEARCFGTSGGDNVRSFWTWEFMFPGRTREEIRAMLPHAAALLDLTIDIPLSPTLTEHDIEDFAQAVDKVLARRRMRRDGGAVTLTPQAGLEYPNLLLVGFVKCGTTSLAKYLSHHPTVATPIAKELYFLLDEGSPFASMQPVIDGLAFDGSAVPKRQKHYIDYFPRDARYRYALDATPYYYAQEAAIQYSERHPDVRIVFMTRDPATRMLSSYRFFKEMYQEYADGTFHEFVEALLDVDGTRESYRRRIRKEFFRKSFDIELDMGCYAAHIARWIDRLGSAKIFVGSVEELRDRPHSLMSRLCGFLGLDAKPYRDFVYRPYMQSYEVRISLLQKLGRRLAREDPMRYDRIAQYQSPFHRVGSVRIRTLLDTVYKSMQHKGKSHEKHAPAMRLLRGFYRPYNVTLKERFGIDYLSERTAAGE